MSDIFTPYQRHLNMAAIHSFNTKPEMTLRRALWHLGFRYRVNDRRFPGSPDIVLPKYRTVIFVHGCFWHGHKGCKKYTVPKSNSDFWVAKVRRNKERDQEVWRQLEAKGWFVIIVWECQLRKSELEETIRRMEEEIYRNGGRYRQEKEDRSKICKVYREERRQLQEREFAFKSELGSYFPLK